MKNSLFSMVILATAALATLVHPTTAFAGEGPSLFVEIDPLTYVLSGYSGIIGVKRNRESHRATSLGFFSEDAPSFLVNMNGNQNWSLRAKGVFIRESYYFRSAVEGGFFIGGQASWHEFRYTNSQVQGATVTHEWTLMPYGGYQLFIASSFYVLPWVGINIPVVTSGDASVGGLTYKSLSVIPFAAIHVGFQF